MLRKWWKGVAQAKEVCYASVGRVSRKWRKSVEEYCANGARVLKSVSQVVEEFKETAHREQEST